MNRTCSCPRACASPGTESCGTTVMPMPEATMCLMVSRLEPSKLLRMPSASLEKRANSGHTSSTWSRKQWPVPSSSMVSRFSSSALMRLRLASGCALGTATRKGSSYSGAMARPVSGKGSARMAASSSPVRSISSSLTDERHLWRVFNDVAHQFRQQIRADGVDHPQAQRAAHRVLAGLGEFLDAGGLFQHGLSLAHDLLAQGRDAHFRATALEQLHGQALRHAEAVLLIHDRQPQAREDHIVLNHRMRAHGQRGFTAGQLRQHLGPALALAAAGEPGHLQPQRLQPLHQFAEMLLGQNFGRRHQGALPAAVDGAGGRQRRHHRLARTDIALQQAVHGLGQGNVGANLFGHAGLGAGQGEGQHGFQAFGEAFAFVGACVGACACACACACANPRQHRRMQQRALRPGLRLRQLLGQ
ncbi:hypothetical protein B566_EDAN019179, partial [Ephemera danica]